MQSLRRLHHRCAAIAAPPPPLPPPPLRRYRHCCRCAATASAISAPRGWATIGSMGAQRGTTKQQSTNLYCVVATDDDDDGGDDNEKRAVRSRRRRRRRPLRGGARIGAMIGLTGAWRGHQHNNQQFEVGAVKAPGGEGGKAKAGGATTMTVTTTAKREGG